MQTAWKLRTLRWYYLVVGRLIPSLAERMLWRIFIPRRRVLTPTHKSVLQQAQPFTVPLATTPTEIGQSLLLADYHWGSQGNTVLLVHGWKSMAVDFYKLILLLVQQGYQVDALDFPAHGASPGQQTNLQEMAQALQTYVQNRGVPYAIVAHSIGGLAAAIFLAQNSIALEQFVFIGSPISARSTLEATFDKLHVPNIVRNLFYQRLARLLDVPLESFIFGPSAALNTQRILAVYDISDSLVDFAEPANYLLRNPAIDCLLVNEVGHHKLLRQPAIWNVLLAFLKNSTSHAAANKLA